MAYSTPQGNAITGTWVDADSYTAPDGDSVTGVATEYQDASVSVSLSVPTLVTETLTGVIRLYNEDGTRYYSQSTDTTWEKVAGNAVTGSWTFGYAYTAPDGDEVTGEVTKYQDAEYSASLTVPTPSVTMTGGEGVVMWRNTTKYETILYRYYSAPALTTTIVLGNVTDEQLDVTDATFEVDLACPHFDFVPTIEGVQSETLKVTLDVPSVSITMEAQARTVMTGEMEVSLTPPANLPMQLIAWWKYFDGAGEVSLSLPELVTPTLDATAHQVHSLGSSATLEAPAPHAVSFTGEGEQDLDLPDTDGTLIETSTKGDAQRTASGVAVRHADGTRMVTGELVTHTEATGVHICTGFTLQEATQIQNSLDLSSDEASQIQARLETSATDATDIHVSLDLSSDDATQVHAGEVILTQEATRTKTGVETTQTDATTVHSQFESKEYYRSDLLKKKLVVDQGDAVWPFGDRPDDDEDTYTAPDLDATLCFPPLSNNPTLPATVTLTAAGYTGACMVGFADGGTPTESYASTTIPTKKVYRVKNTVKLVTTSGDVVPAEGLKLSIDSDSWTWSWSVQVPSSALSLVYANPGDDFVQIIATINSEQFRLVVESLSRSRSFGSSWLTVSGRGYAAILAAPTAPSLNRTNTETVSANQLMVAALEYNNVSIGWDIEWNITDWDVPAGCWNNTGTYIEHAVKIAEAGGGYIQAADKAKTLVVQPYFPSAPWNWSVSDAELALPEDVCITESVTWVDNVFYNAVWITGNEDGRRDLILRSTRTTSDNEEDENGYLFSSTIQDNLATSEYMTTQRGLRVLGEGGRVVTFTVTLPVLEDYGGIIHPGTMVQYTENDNVRIGITRAVSVEQSFPTVHQTLTIECHEYE